MNKHLLNSNSEEKKELQLEEIVEKASEILKEVENFTDKHLNLNRNTDIKFPGGVITQANVYRDKLPFISNDKEGDILKTNISYTLMITDVYQWMLRRFWFWGVVKEMIIKNLICLLGNVVESVCKYICEKCDLAKSINDDDLRKIKKFVEEELEDKYTEDNIKGYLGNLPNRDVGLRKGLNLLEDERIIDGEIKEKTLRIWGIRCKEHLSTLREKEFEEYNEELLTKEVRNFKDFMNSICKAYRSGKMKIVDGG